MHHYIYMIINNNLESEKIFYIGKRSTDKEPKFDEYYMGSGVDLQKDYKKYGTNYYIKIILQECETEEEAYELEKLLVDKEWVERSDTYNKVLGGCLGWGLTGHHLTDEHKEKLRGKNHHSYGKHLSDETKKKMSISKKKNPHPLRGKEMPQEWKDKISKTQQGREMSQEWKDKIGKAHKGKIVSEETRKKLSDINKGKKLTPETVEKIRKSSTNRTHNEEVRKRISEINKGRMWINKDGQRKRVPQSELQTFLDMGWKRGKIK